MMNSTIWFKLVACENQETDKPLKQVSGAYQRVKNNNVQVSHVKELIAQKLDLENDDEVELYLYNEPLDSSLTLDFVLQCWLNQKPNGEMINVKLGSSGADYCIILTYGRKLRYQMMNSPIWFQLVACENQETDKPLKQVSGAYQRIKNNNVQVFQVKELIVQKLDLENEDEVELYLYNEPLDSSLTLDFVLQCWLNQKPNDEMINIKLGCSGADYVMVLTYGRTIRHAT